MSGDHKYRGRPALSIRWNRIKRAVRKAQCRNESSSLSDTPGRKGRIGTLQIENAYGQTTSKRIFLPGRFPGATRYDRWLNARVLDEPEQDEPDSH